MCPDLRGKQTCFRSPSGQLNLTSRKKKNNMENKANTEVHKEKNENIDIPYKRTYEEIVNENEHLGKRVRQLLALVGETEKEKKREVDSLKKKLTDKEETIDDLFQERDEAHDVIYELRLKLADAWNINLATNAEKVQEVTRLSKLKEVDKVCCKPAKEDDLKVTSDKGSCIEEKRSAILTDSGIDVQSLEKLIDDKVTAKVEEKFKKRVETDGLIIPESLSDNEFVNVVYTNKGAAKEERKPVNTPT